MTLREKQSLFVRLLGQLIRFVYSQPGLELTLAEGYDDDHKGHMPGSLHYDRLAQDFNLFVDGVYVADSAHPAYATLGVFWKGLNPLCRWGGDFKKADANHFSVTDGGRA